MAEPYYETRGEDYFRESVDADLSEVRTRFLALLPPDARILDAGCGSGRDAAFFASLGHSVSAYDASGTLAQLARAHTGLPVAVRTHEELDEEGAFEGIWSCATLLHVPQAREEEVFRRFRRALVPGGVWYLCYRVGQGERSDGERFFRYHTRVTLRALLATWPDLQLVDLWETPDRRPDRDVVWLNALVRRQP